MTDAAASVTNGAAMRPVNGLFTRLARTVIGNATVVTARTEPISTSTAIPTIVIESVDSDEVVAKGDSHANDVANEADGEAIAKTDAAPRRTKFFERFTRVKKEMVVLDGKTFTDSSKVGSMSLDSGLYSYS